MRRGAYHDSVALMLASRAAGAVAGVREAAAVMATPLNRGLVERQGFDLEAEGRELGPGDLLIAVRADDADAAEAALRALDDALRPGPTTQPHGQREAATRSLRSATHRDPGLSLAVLSVPGRHVAWEAAAALEAGLHVFCFSDGITLEREAELKRTAAGRGLLFMGADCGTAILDGVALGFANAVERGPVGVVGASGTGIQEVTCLLDLAGVGVSHAVGVGGRDLSAEVGGLGTLQALELLGSDPGTEVIVVVSKPPDAEVAARVRAAAEDLGKPVVLALLGSEAWRSSSGRVRAGGSLAGAASVAAELAGGIPLDWTLPLHGPPRAGAVRGLFCGGTLCDEAMRVVAEEFGPVRSNVPLRPEWRVADVHESEGHTFVDFGDDALTEGRAHPMIDPALRLERLARELADPGVSVVVLDVVLGYGSHPDPAAGLVAVMEDAGEGRAHVVVALCGARGDPQGLDDQAERLSAVGAIVTRGGAEHAGSVAVELTERRP